MKQSCKEKNPRLGKVGGQAVIEGVMMRSGEHLSVSVRSADGSIQTKNSTFVSARQKHKVLGFPIIRGVVAFVESLRMSFSTLNDAANMLGIEEEEGKFEKWLKKNADKYEIDTLDMIGDEWKKKDFSAHDVVYHVAGIAHADVGNVTEEQKKLYYQVNTELAVETAKKAKAEGIRQFIFMSSMIVYSGCKEKIITKDTKPEPLNFYGDSKWQADIQIRALSDENFKVVVLRPPMIYGKGSKGNYPQLAKLAGTLPMFPEVKNKRSMLHIDNLCEFVKLMIDNEESGVFFPQNGEYTNTSDMVQMIAAVKNHRIVMIPGMSMVVKVMEKIPGKIGNLAEKAFGDLVYDMQMSEYKENYRVHTLLDSIRLTEEE